LPISFFEAAEENPRLVRPAQRKILETTPGVRMELLAWGNTAMEPHLFRIKPGGGSGEPYTHEGEEFLHILRGQFEIWLNDKEHYVLKPGDSLYFESSMPHRWKNPVKVEPWGLGVNPNPPVRPKKASRPICSSFTPRFTPSTPNTPGHKPSPFTMAESSPSAPMKT